MAAGFELAAAFEDHLRAMSDEDWSALVQRVRAPAAASGGGAGDIIPGAAAAEALAEARRRGYITDGKPTR